MADRVYFEAERNAAGLLVVTQVTNGQRKQMFTTPDHRVVERHVGPVLWIDHACIASTEAPS